MTETPLPSEIADTSDPPEGGRLVAELRQAQARAERAERELARTRQSAAYVVGDLMVRAAKEPRRLLTLPRDLWRVWRLRRHRRPISRPATSSARTREVVDREGPRLLVPRLASAPTARSLSLAGAIGAATARAWSPYASVSPALPHEAVALVETIDPDVVVIDTSAALPGGSWSHLGNPAAVDRLLAAGALVDAAHAHGRPVVMLRMTPPSHTAFLDGLAARCDLVVDGPGSTPRDAWHPGIDPLDHVPAAAAPALLWTASFPPSDDAWRAVALAAERIISIDPSLPEPTAWHRALACATGVLIEPARAGILGASPESLLALASGRRVLAPDDADLAAMLAPWPALHDAHSTSRDLADVVASAQGPRPLSSSEHRAALAAILVSASAPTQLARLAARLGIPGRPSNPWGVALLADADVDPMRVIAQSWRPRELVVDRPLPDRATSILLDAGIDIIIGDAHTDADVARLGLSSAYVATQVDLRDPHDLADLLAGTLLGQAPRSHPTDARLVSTP